MARLPEVIILRDVDSSPAIFGGSPAPICALTPGAGHCSDGAIYRSTIEIPPAEPKSSHVSNAATGTMRAQTVCTGIAGKQSPF